MDRNEYRMTRRYRNNKRTRVAKRISYVRKLWVMGCKDGIITCCHNACSLRVVAGSNIGRVYLYNDTQAYCYAAIKARRMLSNSKNRREYGTIRDMKVSEEGNIAFGRNESANATDFVADIACEYLVAYKKGRGRSIDSLIRNKVDQSYNKAEGYWKADYYVRLLGSGKAEKISYQCFHGSWQKRPNLYRINQWKAFAERHPNMVEFVEYRYAPRTWGDTEQNPRSILTEPTESLHSVIDRVCTDPVDHSIAVRGLIGNWGYSQIVESFQVSRQRISRVYRDVRNEFGRIESEYRKSLTVA